MFCLWESNSVDKLRNYADTVTGDSSEERIHKLVHSAHECCYIANSLNSALSIEPTVERR